MPRLNEIRKGSEIGQKAKRIKFIWAPCTDCGTPRWVLYRVQLNEPRWALCHKCSRKVVGYNQTGSGKGYKSKEGYRYIRVPEEDPYHPMVKPNGHVLEHRLVMAKFLGRCLESNEIVHHLNGIKDDNSLENLKLVTRQTHGHANDIYKARISELESEVRELDLLLFRQERDRQREFFMAA